MKKGITLKALISGTVTDTAQLEQEYLKSGRDKGGV